MITNSLPLAIVFFSPKFNKIKTDSVTKSSFSLIFGLFDVVQLISFECDNAMTTCMQMRDNGMHQIVKCHCAICNSVSWIDVI